MTTPPDPVGGEQPVPPAPGFALESPRVTYAAARPPVAVHRAFLALTGYLAVGLFWSVERLGFTVGATPGTGGVAVPSVAAAVGGVLIAAGVAVVGLLLAVHMRAGWNWARITVTVLAGLAVVLALLGIAGDAGSFRVTAALYGTLFPVSALALGTVQVVLLVAALVLMHRPSVADYFH